MVVSSSCFRTSTTSDGSFAAPLRERRGVSSRNASSQYPPLFQSVATPFSSPSLPLSLPLLSLTYRWAHQRKVFGKSLLQQAVIRQKLAGMIARVEATQNWLENVTFQMCKMSYREQSKYLAGQIGFLKMFCTRTAQETAADATQIFGGRAISEFILRWWGMKGRCADILYFLSCSQDGYGEEHRALSPHHRFRCSTRRR